MVANDIVGIEREVVAAMVHNGLERPHGAEESGLPVVEARYGETDGKPNDINGNRFHRVVVEGAVRERDIHIVVQGVNMLYHAHLVRAYKMASPVDSTYCIATCSHGRVGA